MTTVTSTLDEKQAADANATYPSAPGSALYTDLINPSATSWNVVDSPGVAGDRFTLAAGLELFTTYSFRPAKRE